MTTPPEMLPDPPTAFRRSTPTEELARVVAKICRRIASDAHANANAIPLPVQPQRFTRQSKTSSKGGGADEA